MLITLAVGFQALILLLAWQIGVLDPAPPKEASLTLPKGSVTEARRVQRETESQLAQMERLQGAALSELMKPVLDAARPDMEIPRPSLVTSMQAMGAMLPMGSLFEGGASAVMAGMDAGALPPPDPVEFLGESMSARRIVLLLDVSGSVKTKMERAGISMNRLREEVNRFVEQLGPNHLFGIIQFTRKWEAFRPELVPATQAVKEEARSWIKQSFRTTGTSGRNWNGGYPNGIEAVLEAAFSMDVQIDEILLLSDADFQRTPLGGGGQDVPWPELRALSRRLQEQSPGETRLRLLAFYPPESMMEQVRGWVRENGPGTLRAY